MSDFNTKLDEILNTLLNVPMWFTEPDRHSELQDIVKKLPLSPQTEAAKQAILDLIMSDVIGEDEITYANYEDALFGGKKVARDKLRAEQRNTLKGGK